MTQLSVMELAKKGDPLAIAALINRSLESKGIHAQAHLEGECLKISLQASQIPNQKAVITIIQRGMIILQVEQIKRVKVLTYRSDNNYLAWQHEFALDDSENQSFTHQSLPNTAIENPENLIQDQNMNLVSNPKGVILVQKLSQIQQNLQEYQDIIVRFTDEHIGTVRCLTTLTELIQVISKPSFLFAAVASNPNLRSLLDTIAESSKTDEHGDQVITNLSILQPGKQWQKAQIRLVTKIFLEPNQDQENLEVQHQGLTLDLQQATPPVIVYPALEYPQEISQSEISQADVNPMLEETKPETPQSNIKIESEVVPDNLKIIEDLDSVSKFGSNQSDALFDDFPNVSSSVTPVSIDNVANNSNSFSDSLFDDFADTSFSNSSIESNPSNTFEDLSEDLSFTQQAQTIIHQVDDETIPTDLDEDLFNDFIFDQSETNSSKSLERVTDSETNIDKNIDEIRARIPKQSLNQLLILMDEETLINNPINDQTSSNGNQYNNQAVVAEVKLNSGADSSSSLPNNDMGATTIERILENMETIALDDISPTSTSSMVTLADFSDDIGF